MSIMTRHDSWTLSSRLESRSLSELTRQVAPPLRTMHQSTEKKFLLCQSFLCPGR
ncbi:hypothetical protein CEXT_203621, partial [Caerostris extrusa]